MELTKFRKVNVFLYCFTPGQLTPTCPPRPGVNPIHQTDVCGIPSLTSGAGSVSAQRSLRLGGGGCPPKPLV